MIGVIVIVVAGDPAPGGTPVPAEVGALSGMISIPPVRCTSTCCGCCWRDDLPSPAIGVMLTLCFKLGVLSFQIFLYLSAISWSLDDEAGELIVGNGFGLLSEDACGSVSRFRFIRPAIAAAADVDAAKPSARERTLLSIFILLTLVKPLPPALVPSPTPGSIANCPKLLDPCIPPAAEPPAPLELPKPLALPPLEPELGEGKTPCTFC